MFNRLRLGKGNQGGNRAGRGGRGGQGKGGGNKPGSGPEGNCVCPSCGHKINHQPGKPCKDLTCPKCGTRMVRE